MKGIRKGIKECVNICRKFKMTEEDICSEIMERFQLTKEQADGPAFCPQGEEKVECRCKQKRKWQYAHKRKQ